MHSHSHFIIFFSYETTVKNRTIYYNFCRDLLIDPSLKSTVAVKVNEKYVRLSGSADGEDQNPNKIKVSFHGYDDKKGNLTTFVEIKLAHGDECLADKSKNYTIVINVTCDYNKEGIEMEWGEFDPEKECEVLIPAYSSLACGDLNTYALARFLENNPVIFGIILLALGLYLCAFGYYTLHISSFVIGIIAVPILLLIIFVGIIGFRNSTLILFLLIISLILGFVVGYFLRLYLKIFVLIVGAVVGYFLGTIVYSAVFSFVHFKYSYLIYYAILAISVAFCAVFGYKNKRISVIVGTSIIGAYCVMRACALFLKDVVRYVSETEIFDLMRTGNFEKISEILTKMYFVYPVIFIVMTVVSAAVQFKINKKEDEVEDYKELEGKLDKTTMLEKKLLRLM